MTHPESPEIIDRQSFEPAYAQLANILQRLVSDGLFCPGDQLPSEAELCRNYQVSPMTVRRAISRLTAMGLVSTRQGSGTFVKQLDLGTAAFRSFELQNLFNKTTLLDVKLLEARTVAADETIAQKLHLNVEDKAIYLRRLLSTNDTPVFLHHEYLVYDPRRPIVEAEMEVTNLQGLFDGTGGKILKRGELSLETAMMSEAEACLLHTKTPSAGFRMEHIFFDFSEKPVSWGWFICPPDQMRFRTTVGIGPRV